jgi:hypothetical protein
MHIQSFKVFSNLAETSSFSKAAQMNSITQSAVSQQVRALERRFRVKLIERGRKNFSLTPEGREFLQASHQVMDILGDLESRIHNLQNLVAGDLCISTIFSIGLHELPPYLRSSGRFIRRWKFVSSIAVRRRFIRAFWTGAPRSVWWPIRHPPRPQGDDVLERPTGPDLFAFTSVSVEAPNSSSPRCRAKIHRLRAGFADAGRSTASCAPGVKVKLVWN